MQNELKIFENEEFGEIRTVTIENDPYFVGKDVAAILGYAKPLNALATHVDEDDSLKQGLIDSMGRTQETIIINESGLYSLILSSKLPSAKKFKRWVTSEVLPTLRKTGSYSVPKSPMQLLELEFAAIKEVDTKVEAVNKDLQDFKQDMPILGIEIDKITNAVRTKGVNVLGGKESNAYKDRSLRSKVYSDIYRELKRQFGVTTYKAIKRSQADMAVTIIQNYELPIILEEQIIDYNNQMVVGVA